MTARQLLEKAEISQPTVSRALAVLDDEVIRVGAGSAVRYALRDIFRGFTSVPIFHVSDEGLIRLNCSLPGSVIAVVSPAASLPALRRCAGTLTRPRPASLVWNKGPSPPERPLQALEPRTNARIRGVIAGA